MAVSFKLYDAISKYLKYMAFVKTASPLTLRAYWGDLKQIFHIKPEDVTAGWGPQSGALFQTEGRAFKVPGPLLSEAELLDRSRAAFQLWTKLSPASRNRKSATLKSFLGYLHGEGVTAADLSERITCPKVPRRLPHFLSVDEIQALLNSLAANGGGPNARKQRALTLLLYGGGLRVSEACKLKWSDIDVSRRLLRVLGKGGKERLVPLPAPVMDILTAAREPDDRFIFGKTALSTRTAYEWVRACGERAGLHQRLHPHALRHSYATHLLGGGANLRTLQELLGHESLRATEKYTHLGIDQLARTMEKHHPLGRKRRAG